MGTDSTITRNEARRLYRAGNHLGLGYAPYVDEETEADTVLDAVKAAESNGWKLVHSRDATDDVAVLVNGDGEYLAIGGDAMGRSVWAIPLSDVPSGNDLAGPITLSDSADVYLPDAHPRRFFPARLNRSDRWNGWAVPFFEQDEARRMLASMVADKVISAFSETTDGCFVTYEIDDDAKEYPQTCHPELVKVDDGHEWTAVSLWPIGAGSWTWLEQDRA